MLYTWLIPLANLALCQMLGSVDSFVSFIQSISRLDKIAILRRCTAHTPLHPPPSRFPSGSVRRKALCSWKRCRLLLLRRRLLVSADFMQISTANLCRAPRIHCCRSADSPGYLVRGGNGREGDSLQVATKYTKCTFHFKLIYARLSPLPSRSPVRRVSAPYAWLRSELEEKAESGAASGRDRCPAAPNSQ